MMTSFTLIAQPKVLREEGLATAGFRIFQSKSDMILEWCAERIGAIIVAFIIVYLYVRLARLAHRSSLPPPHDALSAGDVRAGRARHAFHHAHAITGAASPSPNMFSCVSPSADTR